ncbi:MAG: hypothetical protein H6719_02240 [Sandaracinaceae bacterium]|nr:hypothetical protein [Sandaracinaceae bacterium]
MQGRTSYVLAAVLALCVASTAVEASAQDEGYAWGEDGGSTGQGASSDDPLRIMGYVGGGVGFRLLANLDCPVFCHSFLAPAYLDLGAAVYLPGREVRHGVGLYLSTGLSQDNGIDASSAGQLPLTQWVITPSYQLLLPLWRLLDGMDRDELQVQIRVGIPLVLGQGLGDPGRVDFTFGGELAAAIHYKLLAGFGIYAEVQLDVYGGINDTVHPLVAIDAGLLFDYEVLP